MSVLGRILQVIGWLWFAAGFLGPVFDFDSVNPLPGLVLVFIARMFRARARREMPPGPLESQTGPQSQSGDTPRSERREQTPQPSPPTRVEPTRRPEPPPEPEPSAEASQDLLDRIALAGGEAAEDVSGPKLEEIVSEPIEEVRAPMSSAEMIAQARRRWGRSKR